MKAANQAEWGIRKKKKKKTKADSEGVKGINLVMNLKNITIFFKEKAWRVLVFTYEKTEVHKLVLKVGFADSFYKISPNSN